MRVLSFGLVGYGAWGRCHARAIQESADCELRLSAPTLIARESRLRPRRMWILTVIFGNW
jgi:predicted dehydrogenase